RGKVWINRWSSLAFRQVGSPSPPGAVRSCAYWSRNASCVIGATSSSSDYSVQPGIVLHPVGCHGGEKDVWHVSGPLTPGRRTLRRRHLAISGDSDIHTSHACMGSSHADVLSRRT